MTSFVSYEENFRDFISSIVMVPDLHARWLNTLSFLENCGARKIAACEHPTLVKEEMLKHAAEEFRHAHHLKRQIARVSPIPMETYSLSLLLGGTATLHYLTALEVKTSRYLQNLGYTKVEIQSQAYFLITYAIERRAGELYPIYEEILRNMGSRVFIKSILLEEQEHLSEMMASLAQLPSGETHAEEICAIESRLCCSWLTSLPHF